MTSQAQLSVILAARDRYSKEVKGFQNSLSNTAKSARTAGIALAGISAAGIVMGKNFVDAARVQIQSEKVLAQVVENTGASWANYEQQVKAATAALQGKTNFGDEEQLQVLARVVAITGDVNQALQVLPVLLDAASVSGQSLSSISNTLTRALTGEVNQARSLGITFDATATFAERLAIVQASVGGAAQSNIDPLTQLGNTIGDLKEVIGRQLIPILQPLIQGVINVVNNIQNMNPTILRTAVIVGVAVTAFATLAAPILLFIGFLPALIAGFTALGFAVTFATGPVGIIIVAIAALVAVGIAVWKNWDTIKEKAAQLWNFLRPVFENGINFLIGLFNKMTFVYREGLALLLEGAKKVAGIFNQDLAQGIQTAIDALRQGVPEVQLAAMEIQRVGQESETAGQSAGVLASQIGSVGDAAAGASTSIGEVGQAIVEMGVIEKSRMEARLDLLKDLRERAQATTDAAIANADQEIAARQRVTQTWDDLRFTISNVGQAISDHGLRTQQILQAIASASGVSIGDIISQLDAMGIAANDTQAIIEAFGNKGAAAVLNLAREIQGLTGDLNALKVQATEIDRTKQGTLSPENARRIALLATMDHLRNQIARLTQRIAGSTDPVQIQRDRDVIAELWSNWNRQKAELESFQTRPGQIKVVPGPMQQARMAMVHGGEIIGRPGRGSGEYYDLRGATIFGWDDFRRKVAQAQKQTKRLGGEI